MPNLKQNNNGTSVISNTYDNAVISLSENLCVSLDTARNVTDIATRSYPAADVYRFLIEEFPHVIRYHVLTLQSKEKLYGEDTPYDVSYRFGPMFGSCPKTYSFEHRQICHTFPAAFYKFFENVLYPNIKDKFRRLLFNLQALSEQIGVDDMEEIFKLVQQLNEDGVKELEDFSWHCKGHRLGEAVDQRNATSIISWRAKNIPEHIQLALTNQTGFPTNLQNAHDALRDTLVIDKETRVSILQKLTSQQLLHIPNVAKTLQLKTAYIRLTPGALDTFESFRVQLLYTAFPSDHGQQFYNIRRIMMDDLPGDILEMFASRALYERTRSLPAIFCQNQVNCWGIMTQPHNVLEYDAAMSRVAQGSPMGYLNFINTPAKEPIFNGYNELTLATAAIGAGMLLGAGYFVGKSLYRQFTFFSKCFNKCRKTKEKVEAALPSHVKYTMLSQNP